MLGGLKITLRVDKYKMMSEITELLGVTNICTLCEFKEEEDSLLIEKKMCEVCKDKCLWRISKDTLNKLDEIITSNVDVDW